MKLALSYQHIRLIFDSQAWILYLQAQTFSVVESILFEKNYCCHSVQIKGYIEFFLSKTMSHDFMVCFNKVLIPTCSDQHCPVLKTNF